MASIFGSSASPPANVLLQIKAGKLTQSGRQLSPDCRKGLLQLKKGDDGLTHLIWKERSAQADEDDLIVFQGDARLEHLPACASGFAFSLVFASGRKSFYWSQEPRKKGVGWEEVQKEKELIQKANDILNGTPAPAAASPAEVGFGGMTRSQLIAMLSGGADASSPAAAPEPAPVAAAPAASSAVPTPAPAAAAAFSADSIASILSGIPAAAPPAAPPASSPAPSTTPTPFSADSIANILSGIQPQQQVEPLTLNAVLAPEATVPLVDGAMERRLSEYLPGGGSAHMESVRETLTTPQIAQAAARLTEALHSGDAAGLVVELGLNPNYAGLGVEPFLRALQEATPKPEGEGDDEPKPMEE